MTATGNPTGRRTGPKCGARKSSNGEPCKAPAGYRTDHVGRGPCSTHRGNTPGMRAKYARELVNAEVAKWQETNGFPAAVEAAVSGPEVLLRSLARAEATVMWIRGRIALWNVNAASANDDRRDGDRTGMFHLVDVKYARDDDDRAVAGTAVVGESERAAWLRVLFDWEQFTAKTAAKVSQLGIQEQALRVLASQAPNIEAVLLLAASKLGMEMDAEGVRAAVAAAAREVAPAARPASLRDVQARAMLSA